MTLARNVEIKLRAEDLQRLARSLQGIIGARDCGILEQRDIFFHSPCGRLKLRLDATAPAQLIHYERTDAAELRPSDYRIVEVADGERMQAILAAALGTRGEVHKRRHLFLHDNVRIHLDEVDGLGRFVEIEAVVDASHDAAACHLQAQRLLDALGLANAPRESQAYIELLQAPSPQPDHKSNNAEGNPE